MKNTSAINSAAYVNRRRATEAVGNIARRQLISVVDAVVKRCWLVLEGGEATLALSLAPAIDAVPGRACYTMIFY